MFPFHFSKTEHKSKGSTEQKLFSRKKEARNFQKVVFYAATFFGTQDKCTNCQEHLQCIKYLAALYSLTQSYIDLKKKKKKNVAILVKT
jgi:hypothetical protein